MSAGNSEYLFSFQKTGLNIIKDFRHTNDF